MTFQTDFDWTRFEDLVSPDQAAELLREFYGKRAGLAAAYSGLQASEDNRREDARFWSQVLDRLRPNPLKTDTRADTKSSLTFLPEQTPSTMMETMMRRNRFHIWRSPAGRLCYGRADRGIELMIMDRNAAGLVGSMVEPAILYAARFSDGLPLFQITSTTAQDVIANLETLTDLAVRTDECCHCLGMIDSIATASQCLELIVERCGG